MSLKALIKSEFNLNIEKINFDLYKSNNFGHFSTSISFEVAKHMGKSPNDVGDIIIKKLGEYLASPLFFLEYKNLNGFINFYVPDSDLIYNPRDLIFSSRGNQLGSGNSFEGKKVLVEYTDPNPFKQFHMGHFMTNALGECVFRLIKSQGAETNNLCYSGDVGIHVAKTIFGLLNKFENKEYSLEDYLNFSNKKTIEQLGEAYVLGSSLYQDEINKEQIQDLNNLIFTISQKYASKEGVEIVNKYEHSGQFDFEKIEKIYDKGRTESIDYFKSIYKKLGSNFKELYFESTTGEFGSKFVKESPIF